MHHAAHTCKCVYWRHCGEQDLQLSSMGHITVKVTMKRDQLFIYFYKAIKHGCWRLAVKMLRF